jgi:DNA repair ATPase RecN
MIQGISIQNYQSHKETLIELHKGVNVFIGTTDSGKTAIIRGFGWALNNSPTGDSFRSRWGGETLVEVTLDGKVVTRSKRKGRDLYKLDKEEFKTFGATVPDEIAATFNMSDINLQKQLDQPFLLSETAGHVAAYLNKVANLDKLDNAQKGIKKELRDVSSVLGYDREALKTTKKGIKKYKHIPVLEKKINTLNLKQDSLTSTNAAIIDLLSYKDSLSNVGEEINEYIRLMSAASGIPVALLKMTDKKETDVKLHKIKNTKRNITNCEHEIEDLEEVLEGEDLVYSVVRKKKEQTNLNDQIDSIAFFVTNFISANKKLNRNKEKQGELNKQLPSVCPFCKTKIKTKKHNHGKGVESRVS